MEYYLERFNSNSILRSRDHQARNISSLPLMGLILKRFQIKFMSNLSTLTMQDLLSNKTLRALQSLNRVTPSLLNSCRIRSKTSSHGLIGNIMMFLFMNVSQSENPLVGLTSD